MRDIPLSKKDINDFFNEHLPYRLAMLKTHLLIEQNSINYENHINICSYEASVIACRMFVNFFGLKGKENPIRLVENHKYSKFKGKSYEVKIVDLGGTFVNINYLQDKEKDLLARIYLTGNNATAHLTHNAPYGGEWKILHPAIELIDRLLDENLFNVTGRKKLIK